MSPMKIVANKDGRLEEQINIVNPGDRDWTKHRYVLQFGAYGWTVLLVWANSLDDALDESIDWIVDHAPGLLCDDEVQEEYERLIAEGKSEEEAQEEAEVDTTCGGNAGNRINSWDWAIVAEDPSRDVLLTIMGRDQERKARS